MTSKKSILRQPRLLVHLFAANLCAGLAIMGASLYLCLRPLIAEHLRLAEKDAQDLARNLALHLDDRSDKISRALAKQAERYEKSPRNDHEKILSETITSFYDLQDVSGYIVNRDNIVTHVSTPLIQNYVGLSFDQQKGSFSQEVRKGLHVSNLLLPIDSNIPHFNWEQEISDGEAIENSKIILEMNLKDIQIWCHNIRSSDHRVAMALITLDKKSSIFDCDARTRRTRFWETFQKQESSSDVNSSFHYKNQEYSTFTFRPKKLPVMIVAAVPVTTFFSYLIEKKSSLVYLSLAAVIVYLTIILWLKVTFEKGLKKIQDLARAHTDSELKQSPTEPKYIELKDTFRVIEKAQKFHDDQNKKKNSLWKITSALDSCLNPTDILNKATELMCTHLGAESAWFIPDASQFKDYLGIGWAWEKHKGRPLAEAEILLIRSSCESQAFEGLPITWKNAVIGQIYARKDENIKPFKGEMISTLAQIVEMHLKRYAACFHAACSLLDSPMTTPILKNYKKDFTFENSSCRIATFYRPSARYRGEFFYVLKSPDEELLLFIYGGPNAQTPSGSNPEEFQGSINALSWNIFGLIQSIEEQFSKKIPLFQRKVLHMIDKSIVAFDPSFKDLWSYFVASYDTQSGALSISSKGNHPVIEPQPSKSGSHPENPQFNRNTDIARSTHEHQLLESSLTLPSNGPTLVVPGCEASNPGSRHEIYEEVMMRHISKTKSGISSIELRDQLQALHNYFYQNQPLEFPSCYILIEALPSGSTKNGDLQNVS
jgi:hypothetical protein